MKSLAKFSTSFCVVVCVALGSGWTDGWYLLWGPIAATLPLAGYGIYKWAVAARRRETPSTDDYGDASEFDGQTLVSGETTGAAELPLDAGVSPTPQSLVVGGLTGAGFGLLLCLYLLIAFTGLQQVPWVYDSYYDSDRVKLEAKLTTLEQAGNYGAGVAAIEDRLTRKTSVKWRQTLNVRLYGDLIQHACRLAVPQRLSLLDKASQLAVECRLDDTAVRTLLDQAHREVNLHARIDDLRRQKKWPTIIDVLKVELMRDENSVATAKMLYDACCTAATHSDSHDQQIAFYTQAAELAKRYEMTDGQAQTALRQIRLAQETNQQHAQQLSDLRQLSTATRRSLLEEMIRAAAELPSLRKRLDALRRISTTASEFGVELPDLLQQIADLDKSLANQTQLGARIAGLRQGEKLDELISLLVDEVRKGNRNEWTQPWDADLLACLGAWCDAATGSTTPQIAIRRERLQRAAATAAECGLDARDLKRRLASVELVLADHERIRLRIDELTRDRRFDDLMAYLKVRIDERPEAEWPIPYGQELYAATVAAALDNSDLNRRAALLREAIATAMKYRFGNDSEADMHLAATEQEIRQQAEEERRRVTPVDLPAGLRAGIAKISSDAWPFVTCDFWAEAENGEPLTTLQPKDFTVTLDGRAAPFLVQPVTVDAVPGRFVILVDLSGSAAPVVPIIKTGVTGLARNLAEAKAQMRLITFNAEVDAKQSWTTDPAKISTAAQAFKAEGGTALYLALLTAAEELGRQPAAGERHIFLFTDGKDSTAGASLDDVLLQFRAKGITVSAIALRTNDLDPKVLERLASETGGQYLEAVNSKELGARFAEAARSIHRHRYRLVLDAAANPRNNGQNSEEIRVKVGRGEGGVATEWLR